MMTMMTTTISRNPAQQISEKLMAIRTRIITILVHRNPNMMMTTTATRIIIAGHPPEQVPLRKQFLIRNMKMMIIAPLLSDRITMGKLILHHLHDLTMMTITVHHRPQNLHHVRSTVIMMTTMIIIRIPSQKLTIRRRRRMVIIPIDLVRIMMISSRTKVDRVRVIDSNLLMVMTVKCDIVFFFFPSNHIFLLTQTNH